MHKPIYTNRKLFMAASLDESVAKEMEEHSGKIVADLQYMFTEGTDLLIGTDYVDGFPSVLVFNSPDGKDHFTQLRKANAAIGGNGLYKRREDSTFYNQKTSNQRSRQNIIELDLKRGTLSEVGIPAKDIVQHFSAYGFDTFTGNVIIGDYPDRILLGKRAPVTEMYENVKEISENLGFSERYQPIDSIFRRI